MKIYFCLVKNVLHISTVNVNWGFYKSVVCDSTQFTTNAISSDMSYCMSVCFTLSCGAVVGGHGYSVRSIWTMDESALSLTSMEKEVRPLRWKSVSNKVSATVKLLVYELIFIFSNKSMGCGGSTKCMSILFWDSLKKEKESIKYLTIARIAGGFGNDVYLSSVQCYTVETSGPMLIKFGMPSYLVISLIYPQLKFRACH